MTASVLDATIHQSHPGTTYGQIISASLVLEGDALETLLGIAKEPQPYPYARELYLDATDAVDGTDPSTTRVILFAIHTRLLESSGHFSTFGLLLQAVTADSHQRVGAFRLTGPKETQDTFSVNGSHFQRQTVKIV